MSAVPPADSRGSLAALLFALTAERLRAHYDHGHWMSEAEGARLAGEWLARTRRTLPLDSRRRLAALSDTLAREMTDSLSEQAGLALAHAMMDALDPREDSDLARTLMAECERRLAEAEEDRAPQ